MDKMKFAMSYKRLGIELESRKKWGRLLLAQWSPETNEIFVLREKAIPTSTVVKAEVFARFKAVPEKVHMLHLMRLEKKGERLLGYAHYLPVEKGIYLDSLRTMQAHRKRDVASSLLAYIKTRKKDIALLTSKGAEPFYKALGFVERGMYRELPAEKPLPKRRFEAGVRKFLILPRKRGRLRL